jgi:hypothetical protein
MKSSVTLASVLLAAAFNLPSASLAQATMTPQEDYAKRLRAAELVIPLTSDLFGDSVGLFNGATEFAVVDIDIPGNGGLPVQLRRRFKVESRKELSFLGGFGIWGHRRSLSPWSLRPDVQVEPGRKRRRQSLLPAVVSESEFTAQPAGDLVRDPDAHPRRRRS